MNVDLASVRQQTFSGQGVLRISGFLITEVFLKFMTLILYANLLFSCRVILSLILALTIQRIVPYFSVIFVDITGIWMNRDLV